MILICLILLSLGHTQLKYHNLLLGEIWVLPHQPLHLSICFVLRKIFGNGLESLALLLTSLLRLFNQTRSRGNRIISWPDSRHTKLANLLCGRVVISLDVEYILQPLFLDLFRLNHY